MIENTQCTIFIWHNNITELWSIIGFESTKYLSDKVSFVREVLCTKTMCTCITSLLNMEFSSRSKYLSKCMHRGTERVGFVGNINEVRSSSAMNTGFGRYLHMASVAVQQKVSIPRDTHAQMETTTWERACCIYDRNRRQPWI